MYLYLKHECISIFYSLIRFPTVIKDRVLPYSDNSSKASAIPILNLLIYDHLLHPNPRLMCSIESLAAIIGE